MFNLDNVYKSLIAAQENGEQTVLLGLRLCSREYTGSLFALNFAKNTFAGQWWARLDS
jgi:hypothetical protein